MGYVMIQKILQIAFEMIMPPSLSIEEENLVRSAREGQTLSLPPQTTNQYRKYFETYTQVRRGKTDTVVGNGFLASSPFIILRVFESFPSLAVQAAAATALLATTTSAIWGNNIRKMADMVIESAKVGYNRRVDRYMDYMQGYADYFARKTYVSEMSEAVKSGKKLSLSELAKLVKIERHHFDTDCDQLTITVLQTKLMLAIQDKQIEEFTIASTQPADNIEIAENELAEILRVQFYSATVIKPDVPQEQDHHLETNLQNNTEDNTDRPSRLTAYNVAAALGRYYREGLTGHARIFQKPKAADHLPPAPTSITVAEFPSVPDLADRIQRFNQMLDLPALDRT